MAEYLSPGVYVEEYDSGATPMQGVSTSTAGFVGLAERGPIMGQPQLVTSFADYKRMYGGYLSEAGYGSNRFLPYAVEQFFSNGGARAYIMRAVPGDARTGSCVSGVLKISAANPGAWAEDLRVVVSPASKAKTQVLAVSGADLTLKNADGFNAGDVVELYDGKTTAYATVKNVLDKVITLDAPCSLDVADAKVGTVKYIKTCEITLTVRLGENVETFENLSLKPDALNDIVAKTAKSDLITVEVLESKAAPAPVKEKDKDGKEIPAPAPKAPSIVPFALCGGNGADLVLTLQGGSNGSVRTATPDAFLGKDDGPGKRTGLQAFQENGNVSIMAIPGVTMPEVQAGLVGFCEGKKSCFAILDVPMELKKTNDVANFRDMYDSTYAAMYHPWLEMYDAGSKRSAYFPPSGAMAGIYARTDVERGVHKAPANEVVRGCTGLSCAYNEGEQDVLNPIGVNLIRAFTGRGIRVWGARTISSNGLWKYLNVRRLFIYVEESIKANTSWVVFEPNSTELWDRVTRTIETFLSTCWRDGALAGSTPSEAFFVECGPTTMTQDDIDNGRLICQIGIAPVKPAEFVIFRITQKTASE
ncbi:phage tail sheath subtilisin-like domain-containing protein [Pseudoflavonifractor phocaeensis]|uniref:phage tail sheath subtilisin-like domain-containing protein n=1 Tax=Oscillospiraceae TaxID=216572 RepID=UPI00174DE263|nr:MULTISPECIES: phage tail sheath subtilisin-like domain-containing protein [Oscillospiraceae]MBM6722018.1 phage tail sheath subtilisin-like domain-containing protein [Pseudoflavonifractor phocaeensis]MBM6884949.1 phage tail sheath subtilisin-like domain-containing protein [Pseudoflavonifractor phocaeensis]